MKKNINRFKKDGYIYIPNAISDELGYFLTQYALFDEMQDFSPDGAQVPNAHAKYGDPAMETLLLKLLPIVEKNTGLSLYPTYSFYRVYRDGDVLHPHIDRESCEISVTLCLNYNYDHERYQWPIIMDGNRIYMQPNSIVIYRGIDLEHAREEFTPPQDDNEYWHVQAFLHYVDANGPHASFKYDLRDSIGGERVYGITKNEENSGKSYIIYLDK
jgi:hypothetical protein